MISINNLQEQVLKNTKDIADIKELDFFINGLGIKVLGIQPNIQSIPEREYEYGDAWLIGVREPYSLYVWTRADVGEEWVNLGNLFVRGPKGERGPKGDKGDTGTSTKWYTSVQQPLDGNYGDIWLHTPSGNIYYRQNTPGGLQWVYTGNIKGVKGDQGDQGDKGIQGDPGPVGPKGDTGDVGGFINIAGILASSQQLPDPMDLHDLTKAYLVGPNPQAYSLYIQIGSDSTTAYWQNMGPLNVATYVSVNGVFQNTWDADTKLDKRGGTYAVYGKLSDGSNGLWSLSFSPYAQSIPLRDGNANITTNTPIQVKDCANKQYVDELVASIPAGGGNQLYLHVLENSDGLDPCGVITFRGSSYLNGELDTSSWARAVSQDSLAIKVCQYMSNAYGYPFNTDNVWKPITISAYGSYGNVAGTIDIDSGGQVLFSTLDEYFSVTSDAIYKINDDGTVTQA